MKEYKYFTFRNFVALNVVDDMYFVDPVGFWRQAKKWELGCAGRVRPPDGSDSSGTLPDSYYKDLRERITPEAFERCLKGLLPLMEEGLIVIGKGDSGEKTSYGYYAVKQPEGTIHDAIQAAREDFAKYQRREFDVENRYVDFEHTWMIQATAKGWEWANRQIALMDNTEYHREQDDFFQELS
jgi:hypothetical protein